MQSTNKEQLMELLHGRKEIIPLIHDILAEHNISDVAYAQVFALLFSTMATNEDEEVAYCKATKDWRLGKKPLSDVKLFCLMSKVCDVVRCYVLSSWEECIFSAWVTSKDVAKAEQEMNLLESLSHVRAILKLAAEQMPYSGNGTISWNLSDSDGEASDEE